MAWCLVLKDYGYLGLAVAIFFAICGMWRLARFNVNADVVHGYFMGLAIPAGGNIVAMSTLLFVETGFDPHVLGYSYPLLMAVVAYLMVSHVHYPNFKGDGAEPIYLPTKIFAALCFAAIIYAGAAALVPAVLAAVFGTYAASGILNSIIAIARKG